METGGIDSASKVNFFLPPLFADSSSLFRCFFQVAIDITGEHWLLGFHSPFRWYPRHQVQADRARPPLQRRSQPAILPSPLTLAVSRTVPTHTVSTLSLLSSKLEGHVALKGRAGLSEL